MQPLLQTPHLPCHVCVFSDVLSDGGGVLDAAIATDSTLTMSCMCFSDVLSDGGGVLDAAIATDSTLTMSCMCFQ